jgi:polyphenol oxidase
MPVSIQPVLIDPFVLYQSELLSTYAERVIHGFTGKPVSLGGPSQSVEIIRENRLAVCQHARLNELRLTLPRQTHTDRFRVNDIPCEEDADAVILTEPGIPAMVQVADCVPIILYEPNRHIGAVIHAGWRGTAQAISRKVATQLVEQYGASPEHMIAVIGPSIGRCCYEVSEDVALEVSHSIPNSADNGWKTTSPSSGKPYIDLKHVNQLQLKAVGVQNTDILVACTRCDGERLWSYRRGENGRQVAFLQLQP